MSGVSSTVLSRKRENCPTDVPTRTRWIGFTDRDSVSRNKSFGRFHPCFIVAPLGVAGVPPVIVLLGCTVPCQHRLCTLDLAPLAHGTSQKSPKNVIEEHL